MYILGTQELKFSLDILNFTVQKQYFLLASKNKLISLIVADTFFKYKKY